MKHDLSTMSRPLDGNADPDVYTKQGGKIPTKNEEKGRIDKKYSMKELFFLRYVGKMKWLVFVSVIK